MQSWAYRLAFAGTAALTLLAALWMGGPTPLESVAAKLLGERWYTVALHGRAVGEFVSRGTRSHDGYRFQTDLRFRLGPEPEVHISDALVFDTGPNHVLREATHLFTSGETSVRTALERHGAGLRARSAGQSMELDWDYRLADYVALESWLAEDPAPPRQTATRSIDLGRLELDRKVWRLVERNDSGTRLRQASPLGDTEVQLDGNLTPRHFDLAGVFSMARVAGPEEAAVWRTTPPHEPPVRYAVPLDTPLATPRSLTRLILRVHAAQEADLGSWPGLAPDGDGRWLLTSTGRARGPAHAGELGPLSRPTPALPAGDPAIGRLAARAVEGARSPSEQVDALVAFVHRYVAYVDRDAVQTVTETVRTRRGDCTEYADLLTTMARALGFPARTVMGLAYDTDATTFALHSWNEVAVDGRWRGVDPTWDQTRLDATHLALPEDRALAVLGLLPQMAFELVAAEYGEVGTR